jgi:hypothetical protein
MCELVVPSLDLGHGPGSLHCPGCSSTHRSLHRVDTGSSHYEMDPLQSLRPPLDRPTCRPVSSSLRSFAPFNGIFERAPCDEWVVQPHSVPLTGFLNLSAALASSSSTALFRAVTVPGCPPSERSPRQRSCTSSEATGCHVVIHRRAGRLVIVALLHPVSPTPAPFGAVAWFPRPLWASFSRARTRFPVTLDPERETLVPPASPASQRYSPCESVHVEPSFPDTTTDALLGFVPSREPFQTSNPRTH